MWVPSMIALCYLRRVVETSHASALRTVAAPALTFVVTALVLTIFRLSYFGYPLPNTYYAKVPPSALYTANEGVKYLWSYFALARPVRMCSRGSCLGRTRPGGQTVETPGAFADRT